MNDRVTRTAQQELVELKEILKRAESSRLSGGKTYTLEEAKAKLEKKLQDRQNGA